MKPEYLTPLTYPAEPSSLAIDLPEYKKKKHGYVKEKGISEKQPQLQNITPKERKHLIAITQKLLDAGQKPDKPILDYALAKMRGQIKKPLKVDVPRLVKAGAKGAMQTYRTLGATALKPQEAVEGLYEKVTGKEHPMKPIRKEMMETAERFWQPSEAEVQAMDDAQFWGKAIPGFIQALGEMPIYIVAGKAGGIANKAMFGKLAAKVGTPAAQRALALVQHSLSVGHGFGGLAIARGIGEEKPIGEILYDVGMAYGTAPAYVLGSSLGGSVGRSVSKEISPKLGQLSGQIIGGSSGFAGAAALTGASAEEVASSATIGALLPIFISNPYFTKTKVAFKKTQKSKFNPEEVENTKEVLKNQLNTVQDKQVVEVLKNNPPKARDALLKWAMTDDLVGILNRKGAIAAAAMPKVKTVGMFDVDGFKVAQDATKTHNSGNKWLKEIATISDKIVKKYGGKVARLHGDEFALINPTKAIMEEIRVAIEQYPFTWGGKTYKLTVSGGIAQPSKTTQGKGTTPAVFLEADKAMYKAKKAGRNRIEGYIETFAPTEIPTTTAEKGFSFFKLANQLKVPVEQHQAIMDVLRYKTGVEAQTALKNRGVKVDVKTLQQLEPMAKGGAGIEKEYQHSVSKGFENITGNADAVIQDISKTIQRENALLKRNLTKKFEQWRVSNKREADGNIKAILDWAGLHGMKEYVKGVKPEGKGVKDFVLHHKETAKMLNKYTVGDFKKAYEVFGKDAYTMTIAGQKLYAEAASYAAAFRNLAAKYLLETNPVTKAKMAQANVEIGNKMIDLYTKYRTVQTDAGRFIEYAKQNKKADGYRILNNYDKLFQGEEITSFTPENIEGAMGRAARAASAEPGVVVKKVAPRFIDKVNEFQKAVKLTSPTTHIVNMTSNALNHVINADIEKSFSVMWDILGTTIGKKRTTYMGEIKAGAIAGSKIGLVKGTSEALKALRTDQPRARAYETARMGPAIPGVAGKIIRTPFRMLETGDAFFKNINYYTALAQELYATYKKQGWKGKALNDKIANGLKKPPEKLNKIAEAKAEEWLYREKLDPANQMLNKLLQKVPVLQFVVPFFRTPVNVTKWAYRRVPVLGLPGKNLADLKAGGRAARETFARQTTGALIFAGVFTAYKAGILTGSAPRKPDERARFYAAGKMPYAVLIGDRYLSLTRVEPLTSLMKMATGTMEAVDEYKEAKEENEENIGNLLGNTIDKISNALLDQTYVVGLSDMFDAINDPVRYGTKFTKNLVLGSTIPSGVGYVSRVIDPKLRETEGILDVAKAKIPGVSQELEPRLSPLGEEQKRPELLGRIQNLIQPGPKLSEVSEVNKELERLGVTVKFPIASRKVTLEGEKKKKIDIPKDKYNELVRYVGEVMRTELAELVGMDQYKAAGDEEKKAMLEETIKSVQKLTKPYLEDFKKGIRK